VKVIRLSHGKARTIYLCEECAAEFSPFMKYNMSVSLQQAIENLFMQLVKKQNEVTEVADGEAVEETSEPACPGCGLTLADFQNDLCFGCSQCYSAFKGALEPHLRRLHGSVRHVGRVPGGARKSSKVEAAVATLTKELAGAVSDEDFRKAAELRDRIRHLKGELYHGFSEMPEV
jgi:protein arginine kinase activator